MWSALLSDLISANNGRHPGICGATPVDLKGSGTEVGRCQCWDNLGEQKRSAALNWPGRRAALPSRQLCCSCEGTQIRLCQIFLPACRPSLLSPSYSWQTTYVSIAASQMLDTPLVGPQTVEVSFGMWHEKKLSNYFSRQTTLFGQIQNCLFIIGTNERNMTFFQMCM